MLVQEFDINHAYYDSASELNSEEIEQADIVTVYEHLPIGITHTQKMFWLMKIDPNRSPDDHLRSQKLVKRMPMFREKAKAHGITISINPLTTASFAAILHIYEEHLKIFQRSVPYLLKRKQEISDRLQHGEHILGVEIKHHDILVGGGILFVYPERKLLNFGYSAFASDIDGFKHVGQILDHALITKAQELGYDLSRGHGQNPAGLTTPIGVYEFKVKSGFTPYLAEKNVTTFLRSSRCCLSNELVFLQDHNGQTRILVLTDTPTTDQKYGIDTIPEYLQLPFQETITTHIQELQKFIHQR